MLRGALTPDYGALTMEIQYQKDDDDEDEFVMVERVSDSLRISRLDEDEWPETQPGEEPGASAETTITGRKGIEIPIADGQARYDHLPAVPAPKLMQTPQYIPPLYPFSRTHVYVLLSPDAAQGTLKSVVLKGDSVENPFELEVPIEVLSKRSQTIHQLAARKAITELEEGRGWLLYAEDEKGVLVEEKHTVRFQSMVEREAVRLGIKYQIAGKFTSFVAPDIKPETPGETVFCDIEVKEDGDDSDDEDMGCALDFGEDAEMEVDVEEDGEEEEDVQAQGALFGEGMDVKVEETDPLQKMIDLQTFEGYWNLNARLLEAMGLPVRHQAPQEVDPKMWATVLATTFLEVRMSGAQEVWVMVVEKARGWLRGMGEGKDRISEEKWTLAKQLILGAE